MKFAGYIKTF